MVSVKKYLLNLTTRRAAHLFIASLLLGSAAIWFNFALPWLPALIVAIYGSVLLYTTKVYIISHSEMTNNSPYFLGFLLFLVSLVRTFTGISIEGADVQLGFIIRQLGSALATTIVGLPFRQLLFAYSPAQADQDLFFRTLEEELRRSATEFKRSQAELVQLLQEFVEARKSLFSDEEKASRRYVKSLERAISLFDDDLTNYPKVIAGAISASAQSASTLMDKLRELAQAVSNTDSTQITAAIEQFESIRTSAVSLSEELRNLRGSVKELQNSAGELPAAVQRHLQEAKLDFDAARVDIREQLYGAKNDLASVRGELLEKIKTIQSDIDQIDKLLTDFANLTQERIASIR